MDGIIYREMTLIDVEQVYGIECACFTQPWSVKSLQDEILRNDVAHYLVAELDGKIVGYVGMWAMCGEAHMTNIAVASDYRRQGIATNLILNLMRVATDLGANCMTLEVRENNHNAQRIYAALGFKYVGLRRKYYSDTGENALILWNESIVDTLAKNKINLEDKNQ
ncbi:MAG: ribosomal protein S18-alanine N-acetyltransferase [Christensenellaceae bacterium]|nr:ribosomal protein S18-alanine N-acetyltransferase [Christensenellaceae bacterium]